MSVPRKGHESCPGGAGPTPWRGGLWGALALVLMVTLVPERAGAGLHHDLEIQLDPDRRELHARDRIDLQGSGTVTLRLGAAFAIEGAALDGAPVLAGAGPGAGAAGVWRVALGSIEAAHRLEVRYRGRLEPLDRSRDHRGVLQPLPPMAGPEGSYLPAGSGFYPDLDAGPFTYRVTLELPSGQRGLVPGRLVSESAGSGPYRAVFEFVEPAERIDLVAGPYIVRERLLPRAGDRPVRLRTYFSAEVASLASSYLEAVAQGIRRYSDRIGAYPFGEFSVVSSPLPTGFGLPTLTYLGVDVLRLPFIRTTSLGHEVLHSWWGNGVYVDWERGNWSEGLTTFMADYAYREDEGPEAARQLRLEWLRDYAALPAAEDEPLASFTARTHGASQIVGYQKAAMLFLMLRDLVGLTAFDMGLRRFWEAQRFRIAGWAELRRAFEAASGRDLRPFFAQWLERAGAPGLAITAARRLPTTPDGLHVVRLTIAQRASPPYHLRVPVMVQTDGDLHEEVVDLDGTEREAVVRTRERPLAVALDPDFRLFRRLDPDEAPPILRQVIVNPATRLAIPSPDPEVQKAARDLARRLLDAPARLASDGGSDPGPLLVIGLHADVDRFVESRGLPSRPSPLRDRGTAQVWADRQPAGTALVVISGQDGPAIAALGRALPHYGRQSYLVFAEGRVLERGVWPARPRVWRLDP